MKESHLTRGAGIEISFADFLCEYRQSHLTRGAWIEIAAFAAESIACLVAPHTRCVD